MKQRPEGFFLEWLVKVTGFLCASLLVMAQEVDLSKLPPPITRPVDFVQDIQPILEGSCIRCHGPELAMSHFRLDTREFVLKGGDSGVAILPGQSTKSPLIHFVSRFVPEMEMPPKGQGDPLSREQIGLLRAWINQGAAWPAGLILHA